MSDRDTPDLDVEALQISDPATNAVQSFRREYRGRLSKILNRIRHFHGRHEEYEELMDLMVQLEERLHLVVNLENRAGRKRLSTQEEAELGQQFLKRRDRTIDDLLGLMETRYQAWLEKTLAVPEATESAFVVVNMDAIFLPPGDKPDIGVSGDEEFESPHFTERLRQLLSLLQNHDIRTDDVIVVRGRVTSKMMRQAPYFIVEIPRIGREVLVCDQVGEATFVVDGILNRSLIARLSKEKLQERCRGRIVRIIYHNQEQWERELIDALLRDAVFEERGINVRDLEQLRQAIMDKITLEQWAEMKQREKLQFKVSGLGLNAIATRFGVKADPVGKHSVHLELGKKIFGDHEAFRIG